MFARIDIVHRTYEMSYEVALDSVETITKVSGFVSDASWSRHPSDINTSRFPGCNSTLYDCHACFVGGIIKNLDRQLVTGPIHATCSCDCLHDDTTFVVATDLNGDVGFSPGRYLSSPVTRLVREASGRNHGIEKVVPSRGLKAPQNSYVAKENYKKKLVPRIVLFANRIHLKNFQIRCLFEV